MKKLLIFPDIHGSSKWKKYLDLKPDHVIFLGDYVDSYQASDSEIISNLQEIIGYKKNHMNKCTLLWGNHDVQYLHLNDSSWACSGFRTSYSGVIHQLFAQNKDLFKLAHIEGDYLFTHAGVLYEWLEGLKSLLNKSSLEFDKLPLDEYLNNAFQSSYDWKFGEVGTRRGGLRGNIGSPLWADITEISKEYNKYTGSTAIPYNQICGHNPVICHTILKHSSGKFTHTFCDTGTDNYSPLLITI